ncbi:MAG: Dabb family protein [Streptosporangiaceae bacterium]
MIRHVVLIAFTDDATQEQRERVLAGLQALPPLLTGLRAYHPGPDAGLVPGNFDFAVVADFDDAESYLAYRNHPAHRAVIEQTLNPICRERASVQYEI